MFRPHIFGIISLPLKYRMIRSLIKRSCYSQARSAFSIYGVLDRIMGLVQLHFHLNEITCTGQKQQRCSSSKNKVLLILNNV